MTKRKPVYIVLLYTKYEGFEIVKIFSTSEKAEMFAKNYNQLKTLHDDQWLAIDGYTVE